MDFINEFYSNRDERLLVKNVSKGNLIAFGSLYKTYSNRLYRFAFGYLKSEEESEELVQEVFTIIWERRKDLKPDASFKSYLFTIAFNIIRKYFRTRTRLTEYMNKEEIRQEDNETAEITTYDSLRQYIDQLVEKLPPKRREIFVKSRFDGLSIMEIAEELNISHKTVENQITEALRFLRSHLNNENLPLLLFFTLFIN